MTFINILIVAIWKSRQAFRAYGWRNIPLQAVKLPISHNNVVGENTVLQLNILETGVLTLVVQNSSPTRLRLVGDELWTTRVRTPVSKMFRWRTYNSLNTCFNSSPLARMQMIHMQGSCNIIMLDSWETRRDKRQMVVITWNSWPHTCDDIIFVIFCLYHVCGLFG